MSTAKRISLTIVLFIGIVVLVTNFFRVYFINSRSDDSFQNFGSPSIYETSSESSQKPQWKMLSAEENKMPRKRNIWENTLMIEDQSPAIALNAQQQTALDNFIKDRISYTEIYSNVPILNDIRSLPDNSIIIVGRIADYLAPTWVLRLSSTGAILQDFSQKMDHSQVPSFAGYADDIVYIAGSFGDAGCAYHAISAIDLRSGTITKIKQEEMCNSPGIEIDPDLLPSRCNHSPSEADLLKISGELSSKFTIQESAIHIGKVCGMEKVIIIPFAIPSQYQFGVIAQYSSGKTQLQSKTATGSNVFPPVFAEKTGSDIGLLHASEEFQDDIYSYSQNYFYVNPYYDNVGYSDRWNQDYYRSVDNLKFCLKHSCAIKSLFE